MEINIETGADDSFEIVNLKTHSFGENGEPEMIIA
jgi:hypothetical protein